MLAPAFDVLRSGMLPSEAMLLRGGSALKLMDWLLAPPELPPAAPVLLLRAGSGLKLVVA